MIAADAKKACAQRRATEQATQEEKAQAMIRAFNAAATLLSDRVRPILASAAEQVASSETKATLDTDKVFWDGEHWPALVLTLGETAGQQRVTKLEIVCNVRSLQISLTAHRPLSASPEHAATVSIADGNIHHLTDQSTRRLVDEHFNPSDYGHGNLIVMPKRKQL